MKKVYVSSTLDDLKEYRQSASALIRKMKMHPVAMEDYVAEDKIPLEKCLCDIRECDLYVGIIGWRFGFVPPQQTQSITELEYREAVKNGIPCLLFLIAEDAEYDLRLSDRWTGEGNRGEDIEKLRKELELQTSRSLCSSPAHLANELSVSLSNWKTEQEAGAALPSGNNVAFPPPETFETYLESKRIHFCGRKWIFDEIQIWVHSQAPHLLLIKGDPGTGKSAIIAECIHRFADRVLAYHFCEREHGDWLRPGRFVQNLASMMARNLPPFAERIAGDQILKKWHNEDDCENDPISAFYSLIVTPLRDVPAPEEGKKFILVDALDESLAVREQSKTIVDVLAKHHKDLPDWVRVIATTRDRAGIPRRFSHHEVPIVAKHSCNLGDVDEYLDKRLSEPNLMQKLKECGRPAHEIRQLLHEKSEGVFLDLQQTLQGIEDNVYDFDRLEELPPGLGNLYLAWFENQFPDKTGFVPAKRILQTIAAAYQPLTRNELALVTDLDEDEELQPVLMQLSVYLPGREGQYSFYHQRFREWLTGSDLRDDPLGSWCHISDKRGHKMLAECGLKLFQNQKRRMPGYFRKYFPEHLIATKQWEELQNVLCNPDLFEEMWDQGRKYDWMKYWQSLRLHESADPETSCGASLEELIGSEGESERVCRLADLIGSFLRDMGENKAAKPFLERALKMTEQTFGKEHFETATRMHNLAELYRLIGQYDDEAHRKSLPLFEEALRIRELIFPGDHADIAESLHKVGEYYHDRGNYEQALKYYEQSQEMCENCLEENHPCLADCIHDIGVVYLDLGRQESLPDLREQYLNRAIFRIDQAKTLYNSVYGEKNPETATADINIALVYNFRRNFQEAAETARPALAVLKETYPHYHHKVRYALDRLADFSRQNGDPKGSVQYLEDELQQTLHVLGKENLESLRITAKLAATYLLVDSVQKARGLLRTSLQLSEPFSHEQKLNLAAINLELVNNCLLWNIPQKAIPFCEETLELQQQVYGPKHPELCQTLHYAAHLYRLDSRNQQALDAYKRLLELSTSLQGRTHSMTVIALYSSVAMYLIMAEPDAARDCLMSFLGVQEPLNNEARLVLSEHQSQIAEFCRQWGNDSAAISFCEEALELQEQVCGKEHFELSKTIETLAGLYWNVQRDDDSLKMYDRLLSLQEASLGPEHEKVARLRLQLARYYESISRFQDAEREYKTLLEICDKADGTKTDEIVRYLFALKGLHDKQRRNEDSALVGQRIVSICKSDPEKHKELMPLALNNLGFSCVRTQRFSEAIKLLEEALEYYQEAGGDQSATLNNLAEAYLGLGDYQKAEDYCRNSLSLRESNGNPERLAVSQTTLATILQMTGQSEEAEACYKKAIENLNPSSSGCRHYRIETLNRYADFLRMCDRDSEAEKWQNQINSEQTLLSNTANQQPEQ